MTVKRGSPRHEKMREFSGCVVSGITAPWKTLGGRRNRCSKEKLAFARKLRKSMTPSELILWEEVRKRRLGVRFYRQAVVLGYILDFWCPLAQLAVEVDGSYHLKPAQKKYDATRDSNLRTSGVATLRIQNRDAGRPIALTWIKSCLGFRLKEKELARSE